MQYTENYQFRKPVIGVDDADVKDINFNSDRADTLIHNTQISLAPAYDLNETYNTGDVVMYETLMYKCKEDNVTGAWVPEKWERTTAGEEGSGGGGGSSVVPNPQGEPTDTLNTIGIDGTIFDIAGSGKGGSGSAYAETLLYDSGSPTSGAPFNQDVALFDSLSNYDAIVVEWNTSEDRSRESPLETSDTVFCTVQDLLSNNFCLHFSGYGTRWGEITFTDTTFKLFARGGDLTPQIYKIKGLKFGGGGAGDGSEIIPISAGDGTTSRTFTFDKIPKKISMQYVANGWGFYRDIIWGTDRSYYQASQATISESATYIGVSGIVCDEATKSITITGLNAIQASNTTDIVGYMYVEYGGAGGSGGGASEYIPYSNKNNIVCEATLNNFDASSLEWGDGESPIILSQTVSMYNNEAVSIPVNTSGVIAYSDVGGNKQPFTAYMVCKAQTSGNYTRLLSALESHATNMGAMIFGTNNINMGSWNGSTPTGLSATSDYIVCAIQYTGYGLGYCKVNNIDLSPFPLIGSNRYITIGRTDGGSGGDQEPCDILVKYFGVVEGTDTHKAINENVAYLMDKFGIN